MESSCHEPINSIVALSALIEISARREVNSLIIGISAVMYATVKVYIERVTNGIATRFVIKKYIADALK